jgi:hypothetical protein
MIKFNNSNQIIINKQQRLGSHEEQSFLNSLVHLILGSTQKEKQQDVTRLGDQ